MKNEGIKIRSARRVLCCCLWSLLILTAFHKQSVRESTPTPHQPSAPDRQTFVADGLVKELEPDGQTVIIQHEAISNYMGAMTMPFEVHDPKELRGLKPGDAISFRLIVTSKEGWIDSITRRQNAPKALPARPTIHISSGVKPLDEV